MPVQRVASLVLVGSAAALSAGCGADGASAASPVVRVFAASTTTFALQETLDALAVAGGPRATAVVGSSAALARQIEQGAPADLFLSASPVWMDHLEQGGQVVAGTRIDLLANALVVVATAEGRPDRGAAPHPAARGRLVHGRGRGCCRGWGPGACPAGQYAEAALRWAGAWAPSRPSWSRLPTPGGRCPSWSGAPRPSASSTRRTRGPRRTSRWWRSSPRMRTRPSSTPGGGRGPGGAPRCPGGLRPPAGRGRPVGLHPHGLGGPDAHGAGGPGPRAVAVGVERLGRREPRAGRGAGLAAGAPGLPRKPSSTASSTPLVLPPVVVGYLLLVGLGGGSSVGRALEALGLPLAFSWRGRCWRPRCPSPCWCGPSACRWRPSIPALRRPPAPWRLPRAGLLPGHAAAHGAGHPGGDAARFCPGAFGVRRHHHLVASIPGRRAPRRWRCTASPRSPVKRGRRPASAPSASPWPSPPCWPARRWPDGCAPGWRIDRADGGFPGAAGRLLAGRGLLQPAGRGHPRAGGRVRCGQVLRVAVYRRAHAPDVRADLPGGPGLLRCGRGHRRAPAPAADRRGLPGRAALPPP